MKYFKALLHKKNNIQKNLICNANQQNLILSRKSLKKPIQGDRLTIYVKLTFNNTLLTLTNIHGQVLIRVSAGTCGFKGAKKGTPFAAKKTAESFLKKSNEHFSNCHQIKICVCGVGQGRENALRGLAKINKINETKKKNKRINKSISNKIVLIREITKIPHNGCRPPKKRRL